MRAPRVGMLVGGLLGLANCRIEGPDGPAVFVTDHLHVEPSDNDVVCRGTLAHMEAQVVRVAEIFGVELDSTIAVYYGPSAVEENCGEAGGCASSDGAYADFVSIRHELVHAVRFVNGGVGTRFFEEGIAEVLKGVAPIPVTWSFQGGAEGRGPAMLAMLPWGEFVKADYPVAAHFMSWLWTEWGEEVVVAFLNDERYLTAEAVEAAFSEHFGLTLDEADSAWRATSAEEYTWGEVCEPGRNLAWSGSLLEFAGEVDCDLDTTLGPGPRPAENILMRSSCFPLEQAGTLRAEFTAPAGRVTFASVECEQVGGLTPEHLQTKYVSAGETLELPFAPCTWEIMIETALAEPVDFSLRLTRL